MNDTIATGYTFGVRMKCSMGEARALIEPALKAEGFGILDEIDLAATLKAKIGVDRPAYLILSVCNPGLADQAISADPSIGTLLPCKAVLRADGGATIIEFLDPVAAMGIADVPGAAGIAIDARDRLMRVAHALEGK
jgi:uncharacterized protein (DUF302 family)